MVVNPGYIPGPLVIPDVIEVMIVWNLPNGKNASNVLHAFNRGAVSITAPLCNLVQLAIVGDDRWTTYTGILSNAAALGSIKMRSLETALAPQFQSTNAATPGADATPPLPEEVAFCVTLKSAVAGRTGRGRVYLPGLSVDVVNVDGHGIPGLQTTCADFVQAVFDALEEQGLDLCIANRAHAEYISPANGRTVPAMPAGHQLVDFIVAQDNVFDSQRRRK